MDYYIGVNMWFFWIDGKEQSYVIVQGINLYLKWIVGNGFGCQVGSCCYS